MIPALSQDLLNLLSPESKDSLSFSFIIGIFILGEQFYRELRYFAK